MDKIYICDLIPISLDVPTNISGSNVGKLLLQYAFNKMNIDITKHEIVFNEFKKPSIPSISYHYNISHDENLVCVIISDKEVGIDLEYINLNRDVEKLAKKVFSKDSYLKFCNLNTLSEKVEYFYKYWVQYESYVKLLGSSINRHYKEEIPTYEVLTIYDNINHKYYLSTSSKEFEIIRIDINELMR